MLTEFLYSFPIFFFALFATVQVSEMGFQISAIDLSSFYAARAQFVDQDAENLAENGVKQILDTSFNTHVNLNVLDETLGQTVKDIKDTMGELGIISQNSTEKENDGPEFSLQFHPVSIRNHGVVSVATVKALPPRFIHVVENSSNDYEKFDFYTWINRRVSGHTPVPMRGGE